MALQPLGNGAWKMEKLARARLRDAPTGRAAPPSGAAVASTLVVGVEDGEGGKTDSEAEDDELAEAEDVEEGVADGKDVELALVVAEDVGLEVRLIVAVDVELCVLEEVVEVVDEDV